MLCLNTQLVSHAFKKCLTFIVSCLAKICLPKNLGGEGRDVFVSRIPGSYTSRLENVNTRLTHYQEQRTRWQQEDQKTGRILIFYALCRKNKCIANDTPTEIINNQRNGGGMIAGEKPNLGIDVHSARHSFDSINKMVALRLVIHQDVL